MRVWRQGYPGVQYLRSATVFALAVMASFSTHLNAQEFDEIKPLYFTKPYGGTDPLPQIVSILSGGSESEFQASARTSSGGDWLSVSTTRDGTSAAGAGVVVNASSTLEVGNYSGEVVLTGSGASRTVKVHLIVTPPDAANFDKLPSQFNFSLKRGGTTPSQVMQISGVGRETLQWRLAATTFNDANFLSVSAQAGMGPARITVGVVPENLPGAGTKPGVYTGQLVFVSARSTVTVPVRVSVSDSEPGVVRHLNAKKSASSTPAVSQPATGGPNLWPANTANCFCAGFNNQETGYGGLTTAPDGTMSAKLVTEANPLDGDVEHYEYLYTDLGAGLQTLSFHFKADVDSWVFIRSQVDNLGVQRVWFNLNNGTVGANIPAGWTAQINAVGGGWYRASVTFTASFAAINNGFGLARMDQQIAYTAAQLNTTGVYEWGQQWDHGPLTGYVQNAAPCLSFSESADAASVTAGSSIGFTLSVFSQASPDVPVTISNPLPAGTGISWGISPANSACSITGAVGSQTLTCDFPPLSAASLATVHIASSTSTSTCGTFTNVATLHSGASYSSSASASVVVQCSSVTADSVTPASGSGASQSFALQYSDGLGATSLSTAWVWFSATFGSAANSCMVYYDRPGATLYLINDAGSQWLPGAPGSGATLQNSQCSINLATTSVALAGNTLTLNLAMTFKPAYAGAKNIYMYGADISGANSGWQTRGTWTATSGTVVVTADSVTPSSGSGSSQAFALKYSDTAGATGFARAWVWFSATFGSAANSCMVYYDRPGATLYLINDAGTQWLPGTPGSGATLQNNQCSINLATTSVVLASNTLTLNLAMTFKPVYAGAKNIYMYGADTGGTNSGWQTRGTWTATSATPVVTADSVTPSSGSGSSQAFALQYSDTAGATSFSTVWVWFSATFGSAANSCMVYYDRPGATLYLINDAGSQWLPGTPGSGATLQNNQCSINLATTSVVLASNSLTLNLAMTFKPAYAGAKNIYMYGADTGGINSGWQTRGTWTATSTTPVVTADSVTPSSGSGSSQAFALQYSDTAGATSFSTVWVWFNATFSTAANSCMVYYDRPGATLYLINDAGTQWLPGTPGSAATLQNSQCSINLATTSVALASNTLTLNLATTFKPVFAGAKNIYMYGADAGGTNSAWQTRGTWTAQ
jgi:hypothetical protein